MEASTGSVPNQPQHPTFPVDKKERLKPKKKKKASRSAETLFRSTLSSHVRLSEMADRKASLMVSINTIIISITISAYAQKFDTSAALLIPSLLLLTVCLLTIIVSLIATNPTTSPVARRADTTDDRSVDLLFFGSFTQLTPDEYRQQLRKLLTSDDDLYTSMIDNLYAQGQVLARKYRLLKFAYWFFMIGFSVVVTLVAVTLLATY